MYVRILLYKYFKYYYDIYDYVGIHLHEQHRRRRAASAATLDRRGDGEGEGGQHPAAECGPWHHLEEDGHRTAGGGGVPDQSHLSSLLLAGHPVLRPGEGVGSASLDRT